MTGQYVAFFRKDGQWRRNIVAADGYDTARMVASQLGERNGWGKLFLVCDLREELEWAETMGKLSEKRQAAVLNALIRAKEKRMQSMVDNRERLMPDVNRWTMDAHITYAGQFYELACELSVLYGRLDMLEVK